MNSTEFPVLERTEYDRAAQIMAEMVVWTSRDPEVGSLQREEILGSFVIASSFAYEGERGDFGINISDRLIHAGADTVKSNDLANQLTDRNTRRNISALSFLHRDLKQYGLRHGSRKKWVEPKTFIESVLRLE